MITLNKEEQIKAVQRTVFNLLGGSATRKENLQACFAVCVGFRLPIFSYEVLESWPYTMNEEPESEVTAKQIFEKLSKLVPSENVYFLNESTHIFRTEDFCKTEFKVHINTGHCIVVVYCEDTDPNNEENTNSYFFASDLYDGFTDISEKGFFELIKYLEEGSNQFQTSNK